MAEIRIPPVLRPEAGGERLVDVEAGTVREALDTLVARFPALKARVLEGDGVPSFLNVFVDGSDVRLLNGLETAVSPTSKILLLPAVAGG
jgi:molybdopterin synthase sulfur carrier subunit